MTANLQSRSADSSPFGKCDDRADVPLPSHIKEKLSAMACMKKQNLAQYIRSLCIRHVVGEFEYASRMMTETVEGVDGTNVG